MTRYFTFVGVTTSESSIVKIFPRWRERLGLGSDVELEGCDLPLRAPIDEYRRVVQTLRSDPARVGALVTTHKIDVYRAARDLFDEVDAFARLTQEVSCIAWRQGRLLGWAKDPICAGRCFSHMLDTGYFGRTGGEVICFGAGGAGAAISLSLLTRPDRADRPRRVTMTDRDPERLEALRSLHGQIGSDVVVEYVLNDRAERNDALVSSAPPGTIVINATGMGKDVPGAPITYRARFPERGIAWELNYRGSVPFLYQAWEQRTERTLHVEDGWQYFLYGWTSIIEEVFQRPISTKELELLSADASFARPPLPTSIAASSTSV